MIPKNHVHHPPINIPLQRARKIPYKDAVEAPIFVDVGYLVGKTTKAIAEQIIFIINPRDIWLKQLHNRGATLDRRIM